MMEILPMIRKMDKEHSFGVMVDSTLANGNKGNSTVLVFFFHQMVK